MLFTAIIHPCNTRKQRDFASAMDRAFSSVDFANAERLLISIKALASVSGMPPVNTDLREDVLAVALEGQVIATWMPRKNVVND